MSQYNSSSQKQNEQPYELSHQEEVPDLNPKDLLLKKSQVQNLNDVCLDQYDLDQITCYFCKEIVRFPIIKCNICDHLSCQLCYEEFLYIQLKKQQKSQQNLDSQDQNYDDYDEKYCVFLNKDDINSIEHEKAYITLENPYKPEIHDKKPNSGDGEEDMSFLADNLDNLMCLNLYYLLMQLEIVCPFSQNQKQSKKCLIQRPLNHFKYMSHVENCQFREFQCQNQNCLVYYILEDKKKHLETCDFQKIECEYCGIYQYRKHIKNHISHEVCCKKCFTCQKYIKNSEVNLHKQFCRKQNKIENLPSNKTNQSQQHFKIMHIIHSEVDKIEESNINIEKELESLQIEYSSKSNNQSSTQSQIYNQSMEAKQQNGQQQKEDPDNSQEILLSTIIDSINSQYKKDSGENKQTPFKVIQQHQQQIAEPFFNQINNISVLYFQKTKQQK